MTAEELQKMIASNMKRREKLHKRYVVMKPGEKRDEIEAELQRLAFKHIGWAHELAEINKAQ